MTKVPLRVYNREIDEAIDQKQIEEAIAHCRHILKTYPKHIETYRLLGKAYLESQRYGNAADIFQRVLSSIPDDFVSHIGMSIIREDEGNLDAAIWHMERAFESQPYNTAIQGELRRLYGQRDGIEPPKIRMTKGALARMYAKSDLYDQAIAEIRSSMASEPGRTDLQIILAQMYVKNGQESEAIEVCSSLLQRFPYCLEANKLLAELLPKAEQGGETRAYHQRIQAIDPYSAFISPQYPTAVDVPDQAVTIARLDWDGEPADLEISGQPEWARSIGVDVGMTESDEDLPSWLSESPGLAEDEFEESEADDAVKGEIPDWMREIGWEPSNGEFDEIAYRWEDEEESQREEAVEGELPSWLEGIAPEGVIEESEPDESALTPEEIEARLPDWLKEEANGSSDSIIAWLGEKAKQEGIGDEPGQDSVDWLEEAGEAMAPSSAAAFASAVDSFDSDDSSASEWLEDVGPIDDDLPEWLSGLEIPDSEEQTTGESAAPGEITEWLQALSDEPSDSTQEPAKFTGGDLPEGEPGELQDWLKSLDEESEVSVPLPGYEAEEFAEDITGIEPGDIPDWLQGLGEEEPEEEFLPQAEVPQPEMAPEAEPGDIPDWLQGLGEEEPEEEFLPQAEIPQPEIVPEAEPGDIPEWLRGLGEEEPEEEFLPQAEIPQPEIVPEAEPGDIPDWLQGLGEEELEEEFLPEAEAPQPEMAQEAEPGDIPDWLQELGEEEPQEEFLPEAEAPQLEMVSEAEPGDIPDWLQGLGEEEPEEEFLPQAEIPQPEIVPEAEPGDIPDWLQGLGEEELEEEFLPEAEVPQPEMAPEAEPGDVPEWLRGLREEEPEEEFLPEAEVLQPEMAPEAEPGDIPDWLQGLGEEELEEEFLPEAEVPQPEMVPEAEPGDIPDWLQGLGEEELEEEFLPEAEVLQPEMVSEAELGDVPEWLRGLGEEEPEEEFLPEAEVPLPKMVVEAESEEIPDWVQGLEDEKSEEEIFTEPEPPQPEVISEAEREAIPEWLKGLVEEVPEAEIAVTGEEIEVEEEAIDIPEWVEKPVEDSRLGTFPSGVTGWLEDIDEEELAQKRLEYHPGELPPWLENLRGVQEEQMSELSSEELETVEQEIKPTQETPTDEILEPDVTPISDDIDDAMAWLEGLAAKRGIPEEELLSKPEDRSGLPPEWVQELTKEAEAEPGVDVLTEVGGDEFPEGIVDVEESAPVTVEAPEALFGDLKAGDLEDELTSHDPETAMAWLENLADKRKDEEEDFLEPTATLEQPEPLEDQELRESLEDELITEEPEPLTITSDAFTEVEVEPDIELRDADLAWLESLAAKQGVPEEELITTPEERSAEPPEWIQEEALTRDTAPETEPGAEFEVSEPDITFQEEAELEEEHPEDLPEFLSERTKSEAQDEAMVEPEIEVQEISEIKIEGVESEPIPKDIPDWVRERLEAEPEEVILERSKAKLDVIASRAYEDLEETREEEAIPVTEGSLDINTATMIQLERLPSLGFRSAQAIVTFRDEYGPFKSLDELINVPGLDAATLEALKTEVRIESPEKATKREPETGALLPLPKSEPEDEFHAKLLSAQTDFAKGDPKSAITKYGFLIKKGKRLDEVIDDLNQALLGDMPNEICVDILQVLGDAYMKSDKIQNALDAYTKAEELLR